MAVLYLGEHTRPEPQRAKETSRPLAPRRLPNAARVPIGRQLAKLMAAPGDIVTVTKLDRLGRSTRAKQIREVRAGNTPIIRHR